MHKRHKKWKKLDPLEKAMTVKALSDLEKKRKEVLRRVAERVKGSLRP